MQNFAQLLSYETIFTEVKHRPLRIVLGQETEVIELFPQEQRVDNVASGQL